MSAVAPYDLDVVVGPLFGRTPSEFQISHGSGSKLGQTTVQT